ncbi:Alpha/Beta hydrolase protein [Plectosphaerella plurivora]|uniref:Alpha/Beta hydrolase protein n=1 Tax=Plectosphaerella plurivora TaxID=936078 RepID=A0A9P8VHF5_9PEZI|nr:Alpha/Beta hydrolase protein [Plectosphaerella plurivora]
MGRSSKIPVSSGTLEWTPCYAKAECGRLEVPMDYDNPDGAKVILAVLRQKATDMENYKGPVIFNSGGPSNSGIDFLQDEIGVSDRQDLIHDLVGRNHDIIVYDPRSFARSVPRISCWATEQRRSVWAASSPGIPAQYDDPVYLANLQYRARIENSACVDMMGESGILEHVSSTHSARDVHSIMTALGQEKLRFLGQSYGCLLGTFFASMFPEKIERLVCDGNIDPHEITNGTFLTTPPDTDELFDFFASSCAADEQCPLHLDSAAEVRARIDSILENLRSSPVFVPLGEGAEFNYNVQWTPYSAVAMTLIGIVGLPFLAFRDAALALFAIEQGGFGTAENFLAEKPWPRGSDFLDTTYRSPLDPDAGRKGNLGNKYPPTEDWTICNDLPAMPEDLEQFKEWLDRARAQDTIAAAVVGQVLNCMGRTVRAKGLYTGPFGGNTSYPMLFTNARVDPSTSSRMAYSNAEQFPGSGLIVYEGYGHSVMWYADCVKQHINNYFQDGTLPPEDHGCVLDIPINWGG